MSDPVRPDAFRERLLAYLDGELSGPEAREVEKRLASDPEARREADEHRAVARMLAAYSDEPVPAGFSERAVATALASGGDVAGAATSGSGGGAAAPPRLSFLRGGAVRRAAIAASIVLAIGAGVLVGRKTAPVPTPPREASIGEVPDEILSAEDLAAFAALSDEDFELILVGDPEDLADVARGG